jgi:hypothetical protein
MAGDVLTVEVAGQRHQVPVLWRGSVAGAKGPAELAIVQAPAGEALFIRVPSGRWLPCFAHEVDRKKLQVDARGRAAAVGVRAWEQAEAARRREDGERQVRPGRWVK